MKAVLDECTSERATVEASSTRSRSAIERAWSLFVREHGRDRFLLGWATPPPGRRLQASSAAPRNSTSCRNVPQALVGQSAAEAVIKALHFGLLNTSDLLKTEVS